MRKSNWIGALIIGFAASVSACDQAEEGTFEQAGKQVDEAVEQAKEELKETGEQLEEAARDAGKATGQALQDAGQKIEEMSEE